MRAIASFVAAIILAVVPAIGSAAVPDWREPIRLTPDGGGTPAGVVVDAASGGRSIAVWFRGLPDRLVTQRFGPDGTPAGVPVDVLTGGLVQDFSATLATDGTALVLWRRVETGMPVLLARVAPSGVVDGPVEVIPGDQNSFAANLVTRDDGTALLAWRADGSFFARARAIGRDGTPGPVQTIDPDIFGSPRLVSGPGGPAVLLRSRVSVLRHQFLGPDGAPRGEGALVAAQADSPVLATWHGGSLAVWRDIPSGRVLARRLDAAGMPGPVRTISWAAAYDRSIGVAIGSDGRALITWAVAGTDQTVAEARRIEADDRLGPVVRLPVSGKEGQWAVPVTATPSADQLFLVSHSPSGPFGFPGITTHRLDILTIGAGGIVSAPRLLSAAPPEFPHAIGGPAIAAAPDGTAIAAWSGGSRIVVTTRPGPAVLPVSPPAAPADPPPAPGPGPSAGPVPPVVPGPVARVGISGLSLSPRRAVLRPRVGPPVVRIGLRLDRAAPLRLRVTRTLPGRRRGVRCVAPTRALIRAKARPCTRTVAAAALVRPGRAGLNRIAITGLKVGRRTLGPGVYRLRLQAGRAGALSRPLTTTLTVVRAPRPR